MKPTSRRIRGSTDFDLHLLEWSTEGVPLLLLHGFGNEAHIWDEFVPALAPHYAVYALDWRGHGESDWHPDGAYDWDDHLRDLEAVVGAIHEMVDRGAATDFRCDRAA